jgi:hypothetical protein
VGVLVLATVRVTVTAPLVDFKFRVRVSGQNFDSPIYTTNNTSYLDVYNWYPLVPNGAAWTSSILETLEMGLVFVGGDGNELRCTKMEAHVLVDALPDLRLDPVNLGSSSSWISVPSGMQHYQAVNGAWDGDLSYIKSSNLGDVELLSPETLASLPIPNVEKVKVTAAVRTTNKEGAPVPSARQLLRIGGSNYESGVNDLSHQIDLAVDPNPYKWALLSGEFYGDPSLAWPDGSTGGGSWTLSQINSVEIGIENRSAELLRCSQLAFDLFLHPTVISTLEHLPTADSLQYASIPAVSPVQPVGSYYLNINEDPPDDSGSYIGADAGTLGFPAVGTFAVGGGGVVPAGEQVWAVQSTCRIQLGSSAPALVAFCVNDASNELVIGKPRWINGTGTTWFNLTETWYTNPLTGQKWGSSEPDSLEWGVVILEGEAFFSQIKISALTAPDYSSLSDPSQFYLTNAVGAFIGASKATGIVYEINEFGVGTGGYSPSDPTSVTPVITSDTSLVNEVYRASVDKVETEDLSPGTRVTYWCRVPRSNLKGYQVGEIGLYCEVLWSIDPAFPAGYQFLYAIGHSPGQVIVEDDVMLFKLSIDYP